MNVPSSSSSTLDIHRVNCGAGFCGTGFQPVICGAGFQPVETCGTGVQPVKWNIAETRNGSNQTIAQFFWGQGGTGILPVGYVDEILYADVNGDPTESNDCDPDDQTGESTADARYFYHQDRNWNVVALSQYSETGDAYAGLVERYRYTPYGEFVVLKGDSSGNELGNVLLTSSVGNVFAHQGLPMDQEKASYQNRYREYSWNHGRFLQRDPLRTFAAEFHASAELSYLGGMNLYERGASAPTSFLDPLGLKHCGPCNPGDTCCTTWTPGWVLRKFPTKAACVIALYNHIAPSRATRIQADLCAGGGTAICLGNVGRIPALLCFCVYVGGVIGIDMASFIQAYNLCNDE